MIDLFLDTATSISTIAILKDCKLLLQKQIISNNDLSNNIFIHIEELFNDANVKPNEINRVYVSYGPGSFTGIRIGLTIAKVYAFALKIPIIPISSLEIMASTSNGNCIVPMIDARRGYVYAGVYDHSLQVIREDRYISIEKIIEEYPNGIYVSNDELNIQTMKIGINVEKVISKHKNDLSQNPHTIVPNYLKITEAEANLTSV